MTVRTFIGGKWGESELKSLFLNYLGRTHIHNGFYPRGAARACLNGVSYDKTYKLRGYACASVCSTKTGAVDSAVQVSCSGNAPTRVVGAPRSRHRSVYRCTLTGTSLYYNTRAVQDLAQNKSESESFVLHARG
jgi:hypothetical protein